MFIIQGVWREKYGIKRKAVSITVSAFRNKGHCHGMKSDCQSKGHPKNFAPFPKNPAIAKFFIRLGRVDELGSGVRNVNRLIKEYAGSGVPQFIEGQVFKMILPLPAVTENERLKSVLLII